MIRTAYDPVNNLNGAYACASATLFYVEDGHSFYVLNFPDRTLVFTIARRRFGMTGPAALGAPGAGVPIHRGGRGGYPVRRS